jgi:hypothetical protein
VQDKALNLTWFRGGGDVVRDFYTAFRFIRGKNKRASKGTIVRPRPHRDTFWELFLHLSLKKVWG